MGSAEIISGTIANAYVGYTPISNPILLLEINGVPSASSYVAQRSGQSVRFIFPRVTSTGDIYIVAAGQVYGTDLPALTITVKVYVAQ